MPLAPVPAAVVMIEMLPGLLVLLAYGGVVYFVFLVGLTAWKLSHPPRRTYVSAVSRGVPGEPGELAPPLEFVEWTFRSGMLDLPVWDVKGLNPRGPVVVLTHGWGDSRIGALARLGPLSVYASRLIAWDMPGHGEAPGRSRLGLCEAADLGALLDHLQPGPTVLYGWSLGAGVSIEVAARHAAVIGVIAEAPYRLALTPARNVLRAARLPHGVSLRVAMRVLGFSRAVGEAFDRAGLARAVSVPMLVVHGSEDRVSPEADGRAIAEGAPRGVYASIEGGTHNGLWVRPADLEQCLVAIGSFGPLGSYHDGDADATTESDR
jgi:pimeloyl-ACP methyl ester carboxylesterase